MASSPASRLIAFDAVKGTPVKHVVPFGQSQLPGVREAGFVQALELNCNTELHDGNSAEFFWNGDQTYPRLWADIRAAQHSITLQMYYNKPGKMADTLSEDLIERARAGVSVCFVDVWGTSGKGSFEALPAGGVKNREVPAVSFARNQNHSAHHFGWCVSTALAERRLGSTKMVRTGARRQWRDSTCGSSGQQSARSSRRRRMWAEASGTSRRPRL